GAGGGWYLQRQHDLAQKDREGRELAVGATLDKVADLRERARWAEAASLLEQMLGQLGPDAPAHLRGRLEQAVADVTLVADLDAIRLKTSTTVEGKLDTAGANRAYAETFARNGLGSDEEDPQAVAQRVRDSAVKGPLVAALDAWAF